jgi:hypothetical protein
VDLDIDALRARARVRGTLPVHDRDPEACEADLEALVTALEDSRATIKRLADGDDDLRESVEIWIRLYDANLRRANRAEAELKSLRGALPDNVRPLYEALDRLEVLREAVTAAVGACETCARPAEGGASPLDRESSACARCLRALDALQSAAGLLRRKP